MSIMGIKYAPLLGFLIDLFNMIPYVGAIITVVRIIVVDFIDYKLAIKNEVKLKQEVEIYEQIK